jgi:hypothetical protein
MMASGVWIFGLVFCLLGTVVLAALALVALRYLVGERPGDKTTLHTTSAHRPPAEYVGR